jgi:hypothetical protein
MSRYTEDQLIALNNLKEAVQYLNDTGLQVISWMAQGVGVVSISPVEDQDYDDYLSPAVIDEIMKWD